MNEKKTNIIKAVLFLIFLGMMIYPAFQKRYGWYVEEPLNGAIEKPTAPSFNWHDWWEGEYQKEAQTYLKETMGFRPTFVRIHNQIHYWLYNIAVANGVIVGKNDYLYERNYIDAHLGRDYIGYQLIHTKVQKIAFLSDTLEKLNKSLVIVFAPGKGSFYPEYIPTEFNPQQQDSSNYEVYKAALLKTDVHFLDLHQWFRDMKDTAPYPLMPKTGIHWSKYGAVLAADSLLSYLASIDSCKYPDLIIDSVQASEAMEDSEDDVEKGMNLFFNIPDLQMGTPFYHFDYSGELSEKKVAVVADSYYWALNNIGLSKDCFNNGQFWYYNEIIYGEGLDAPIKTADINLQSEIEKNDVIILLSTDANLWKFAFGFIDQLYEVYYPINKNQNLPK